MRRRARDQRWRGRRLWLARLRRQRWPRPRLRGCRRSIRPTDPQQYRAQASAIRAPSPAVGLAVGRRRSISIPSASVLSSPVCRSVSLASAVPLVLISANIALPTSGICSPQAADADNARSVPHVDVGIVCQSQRKNDHSSVQSVDAGQPSYTFAISSCPAGG